MAEERPAREQGIKNHHEGNGQTCKETGGEKGQGP